MTGSKLETAALATSVVTAADQLMMGVRDTREHQPSDANEHYVKAAIAGAIAIGAYQLLQHDENKHRDEQHPRRKHIGDPRPEKIGEEKGHTMDMAAEAIGAYAAGRQMLGYNNHKILKLIAEGLGAAALAREVDKDVVD
ncbi:hypothetical protein B0H67DRAFT_680530 [Lasiosphaeris hirsuta]|uniref:Uncharacterized protein n=1 Tax=Lasiosphaeris hirsuta TaxID=260670 RepID=A0AA40AZW2_9PEZI|nr:hypothetical protein B0H67DRAFT_680530 [Lasiosphaeris hirsuta]